MRKTFFSTPAGYATVAALIVILFALGYFGGRALVSVNAPPTPTDMPEGMGLIEPPLPLTDFTLMSKSGEPISLSDLRGKPALLFFGYTHCPEECPTTLANFTRAKAELGERGDDVSFVFVSVDGERDTPEVVDAYLGNFDASFVGMTGDDAALAPVAQEYGLMSQRVNPEGTPLPDETPAHEDDHEHHGDDDPTAPDNDNYFVAHTSPSFLIDQDGHLRALFFYGAPPQAMAEGLRSLLS